MENKVTKDIDAKESEPESASNLHREFAIKAAKLFDNGQFSESLLLLTKLQEQRPLDTRFTHNFAVTEFYMNDFKNINDFKKKLNSVCSLGEINLDNIESLDDVRNCCLYFNQTILLYHTMQYSSALRILNKVFTFVESMDDELRKSVSLLLIELFLRVHQPDKALSVITYFEKSSHFNSSEKINTTLNSDNVNSYVENDADQNKNLNDNSTDLFKYKLYEYKCKCCLNLHNINACEQELEIFSKHPEKAIMKKSYISDKIYKARCSNINCCAKFLTAYSEYLKGNLKSCVKIMTSIPLENNFVLTGDSVTLAYHNNMGCAHLHMGKPNLASLYFRKAVLENDNNQKLVNSDENEEIKKSLFNSNGSKLPQLMYNLGVSLLHSGKPIEAFDCLTLAVQVYHMNPRLWLRLAECCIMVHKNGNERDFDFINRRKDVLQEVVGSGIHRKLLLNLNLFENNKYSYDAQSFAIPVASLEFATLCLRNSLLLLSGSNVDCSPSNPIIPSQIINLKSAVLAASAYVSLCLGDPIVALNNCRNLLSIPNCLGIHKLLGHLYIAEAFILLDRIPEALEHLKPDYSNYMLPSEQKKVSEKSNRPWKPDNSASARAVFQYNLAVVLALKDELLKAAEILKQVWLTKNNQCEIPVQIISLALYIELSLGHADIARNIIKQNCPQYNNPS